MSPAGKLSHPDAVQALYSEHHGWLARWLRRKLGCPERAADLAHDTFVRVLAVRRGSKTGQVVREPRAFLATLAHGLVVNHWRRLEIERAYLRAAAASPEASSPSPEERALVIETLVQVDAMLGTLPDKVRRAFLMAQLDGLAYREIAAALGVSERMVKKYMARAMLHCLQLDAAGGGP
jgi:RNA polymerase sigma-70 factor (ECF subfamily)